MLSDRNQNVPLLTTGLALLWTGARGKGKGSGFSGFRMTQECLKDERS